MFKTALVTGGNGNLGRLVAQQLEDLGTQVVSLDLPGSEGPNCAVSYTHLTLPTKA